MSFYSDITLGIVLAKILQNSSAYGEKSVMLCIPLRAAYCVRACQSN